MSASVESITNIIQGAPKRYTPQDDPSKVFKHIYKRKEGYYQIVKQIQNDTQQYGGFYNLAEAVNERDLLVRVDWDMDLLVEIPYQTPLFTTEDLPPYPESFNGRRNTGNYFGYEGTMYLNKHINPWRKVWWSSIVYNYHKTSLGVFCDPLSAEIVYLLVKKEVMASDE